MYSFLTAFLVLMKLLSLSQFYAPKSSFRELKKTFQNNSWLVDGNEE